VRTPLIVLKFGGSVLADESCLPRVVHELYRWRREGQRVVAVVSAFARRTDELLASAHELGAGAYSAAATAAIGELQAAALLGAALDRAGIPCSVLTPAALGLVAHGDPLQATPIALDRERLELALERDGLVIVPGFAGVDASGRTVLFGRGGSDLSALFLAHACAARCRLIKDVDGLYEFDPAQPREGRAPKRYASATWDDAGATDGRILQLRALSFARERGFAFEVARLGGVEATLVGAPVTRWASCAASPPPLRVALLGFGTVGGGVWSLARDLREDLEIVAVACRRVEHAHRAGVPEALLTQDACAAARTDADVVVECLGGLEPARSAIAAALLSGKSVVSANKHVLARRGGELRALAATHGGKLLCSAAVGGSAPVLERLSDFGDGLRSVRGVLNGTVNFVLERVCAGAHLDEAVAHARALGLAEVDSRRDLDGSDAADKLRVIGAQLGLGEFEVAREPLDQHVVERARAARRRGARLRHVAELELAPGVRAASVSFREASLDDPLFDLPDAANAAVLVGLDGASARVLGTGAGRWPTAESVLGDVLALRREQLARAARG
jgi:homoserine dehydrogenase